MGRGSWVTYGKEGLHVTYEPEGTGGKRGGGAWPDIEVGGPSVTRCRERLSVTLGVGACVTWWGGIPVMEQMAERLVRQQRSGGLGLTQGQRVPLGDAQGARRTAKCGRSSV